jgi:hypothetical protein
MFIKELFKSLFHFVDEEDYDEMIKVNETLIKEKNETASCLAVYRKFEERLPKIMRYNKAILIDVQISKNGELLHILHDERSKYIFILSPYIIDNTSREAVTQFPYLRYVFDKDSCHIKIEELHSNSGWYNSQTGLYVHEDRGYGTALLKALISLAIQNGFDRNSEVTGMLSNVDARDEKKKRRRNMFYYKRGFDVKPDLNADDGNICATVGRIEERINNV